MSVMQGRGGVPNIFRESITVAGREHRFPFTSFYMIVRTATFPCKLFFTKKDFDADVNYILVPVPANQTPHGLWEGPVEATEVWLKGSGGTAVVEVVSFQRRG